MAARRRKRKAKSKRSRKSDRARVSGKQRYEVAYLARKHKVSAADVRAVIKKVGSSRKKIETALAKM
jgi:hypothetical protein